MENPSCASRFDRWQPQRRAEWTTIWQLLQKWVDPSRLLYGGSALHLSPAAHWRGGRELLVKLERDDDGDAALVESTVSLWTAGILLKITATEETNGRAVIDLDEQQMDEEYWVDPLMRWCLLLVDEIILLYYWPARVFELGKREMKWREVPRAGLPRRASRGGSFLLRGAEFCSAGQILLRGGF